MRRVAACAALLCAIATLPARADARQGYLVVTGDRSSVIDVVLPRATTEDVSARGWLCADFTTRGTYASFVLRPASGRGATAAGLLLKKVRFGGGEPCFAHMSDAIPLKAGRYRLYLMTDGPTTFRIALPGYTRDVVARPRRPLRVDAGYRELPGTVSAVPSEITHPFTLTRRSYVVMGLYVESALPVAYESLRACTAPKGQPCADDFRDGPYSTVFLPNPADPSDTGWVYIGRGLRPEYAPAPGAREARWSVHGADVTRQKTAFWMHVELQEPAYPLGR